MRVRLFGLRLIAAALTALWTLAAALVLLGYRPGGPLDVLVGLAAAGPVVIGLAGLVWPPVARGDRAFAGDRLAGLAAVLVLVPSIGGIVRPARRRGAPRRCCPPSRPAYPWLLALRGDQRCSAGSASPGRCSARPRSGAGASSADR